MHVTKSPDQVVFIELENERTDPRTQELRHNKWGNRQVQSVQGLTAVRPTASLPVAVVNPTGEGVKSGRPAFVLASNCTRYSSFYRSSKRWTSATGVGDYVKWAILGWLPRNDGAFLGKTAFQELVNHCKACVRSHGRETSKNGCNYPTWKYACPIHVRKGSSVVWMPPKNRTFERIHKFPLAIWSGEGWRRKEEVSTHRIQSHHSTASVTVTPRDGMTCKLYDDAL